MKKAFVLVMVLGLFLGLCSCKKTEPPQNTASIESNTDEYETTLIRNLTASENVGEIEKFEINYENSTGTVLVTDKQDLEFLLNYTYNGRFPTDRLHEVYVYPPYCLLTATVNGFETSMYLLKDGSIVKKEMCGDSGVPESEVPYELYTADNDSTLTEERLIELLKKYDGYK